jgi:hypothetical protein
MYLNRPAPRGLRTIDRALPHRLKLIEKRAEAIDANVRLMDDLAALYSRGQAPLSELLGTCRELSDQQDAFLQAVVKYNHQIAAYSQAVVGNRVPAESLVATLIRQPATAVPRMFRDSNVQPAAARQPTLNRGPLNTGPGVGRPTAEPAGAVRPAFEPVPSQRRSTQQAAPSAAAPSGAAPSGAAPSVTSPAFDPRSSLDAKSSFDANSSRSFDANSKSSIDPKSDFDPNSSFQINDSP